MQDEQMMEDTSGGETQEGEQSFEQPAHTGGHSEFELVFVLILIGLLGIGFLAWYVGSGGFDLHWNAKGPAGFAQSADDVSGRDPNVISLRSDASVGKYLVSAESQKALYVYDGEDCVDACLFNFTPYIANKPVDQGNLFTVERSDTGAFQYTWKGRPLYTYAFDTEGSVLGDGADGLWHLARP